jgi:hypothetical protein
VAPTVPTPVDGDAWFDTNTGHLFIYYDDGTSSQWVQTSSGLSGGTDIRTRVGSLESRTTDVETLNTTQDGRLTSVEGVNTTQDGRLTAVEGYAQQSPNYIINGAFDIWQRGTSFSNPVSATFSSDRWRAGFDGSGVTRTVSQQAFALGSAPAAGYEGEYFYRYAQTVAGTSATFSNVLEQPIEDVRTLAGQTITVSFWAKADATRTVRPIFTQFFGTGGSPSSSITTNGTLETLTTSWARYTSTVTLPSMSGKTIGTGNNDCLILTIQSSTINATQTIDIWGVQVEAGSVATPFRRNAPSIQAELAACQRYYWRVTGVGNNARFVEGTANATTQVTTGPILTPVPMRIVPTVSFTGTFVFSDGANISPAFAGSAISNFSATQTDTYPALQMTTTSGLTQFRVYRVEGNGATARYMEMTAEL